MKLYTMIFNATVAVLLLSPFSVNADDFDWAVDLNLRSDANPTRYGSQLAVRFGMPDRRVYDIIRRVDRPSDAYLILRLSEMTSRPPEYIIREYRTKKHHGWGEFASSLGVRPGSANYKAFKSGHDIHDNYDRHDNRDKRSNNSKKDKKHNDHNRGDRD